MGKSNHDELMAQATALRADSPRDTIRRVRLDLLDEATQGVFVAVDVGLVPLAGRSRSRRRRCARS
jgi:hypothetical protein